MKIVADKSIPLQPQGKINPILIGILMLLAVVAGIVVNVKMQNDATTITGVGVNWRQGNPITVVNYFAQWCAPCLREVPELNKFYSLYGQDTPVYAMSYDALSKTQLHEIAIQVGIEFPIINPDTINHLPMKRPDYLPATFLIGPDGKILTTLLGEQTTQTLKQAVENVSKSL